MKDSRIVKLKSKFFLYRAVTYTSFLCIPVWVQKLLPFHQGIHALLMLFYILFMVGQWFILGKEIDHRLKIYYKVNSSMDRIIYRVILGKTCLMLYFTVLSFFPRNLIDDFFWGTWVVLGLFYSWPTRGKIIKETVSSELGEFKFLDSFEKTVLGLSVLLFILSFPQIPALENIEALKLLFDSYEKISPQYWRFLYINYFPFYKYPNLFKVAWCLHFYIVNIGIFLIAVYALLRMYLTRRLSLLGVFAVLSSWSFSKILGGNPGATLFTSYAVIWIWSIIWCSKSATYRSGLFIGMCGYLGTVINQTYFILHLIQIFFIYFFMRDTTFWFKRQFLKYAMLGLILSGITVATNFDSFSSMYTLDIRGNIEIILSFLNRKAFFYLSILGVITVLISMLPGKTSILKSMRIDKEKLLQFLSCVVLLVIFGLVCEGNIMQGFSLLAIISFFSLLPLEWVFQVISRLRSKRNMIYVIYIIICLLDSHLEGRVKILSTLMVN